MKALGAGREVKDWRAELAGRMREMRARGESEQEPEPEGGSDGVAEEVPEQERARPAGRAAIMSSEVKRVIVRRTGPFEVVDELTDSVVATGKYDEVNPLAQQLAEKYNENGEDAVVVKLDEKGREVGIKPFYLDDAGKHDDDPAEETEEEEEDDD